MLSKKEIDFLNRYGSSSRNSAIKYFSQFSSLKQAWEIGEEGSWLWFLVQELNLAPYRQEESLKILQKVSLARAYCANTIRHLIKHDTEIMNIDVMISFGEGKISKRELKDANPYAFSSIYSIKNEPLNSAVVAAYWAGKKVFDANGIKEEAKGSYAKAKKENQKETADICRKYLSEIVLKKLEKIK